MYFEERVSSSYVAFWFHTLEIKIISRSNVSTEWNYLIHDSEACRKAGKFQYPASDRVSDSPDYWLCRCTVVDDNQKFIDMYHDYRKLKHGKLPPEEYLRRYGAFGIMQSKNMEHFYYTCGSVNEKYNVEPTNEDDYVKEVF